MLVTFTNKWSPRNKGALDVSTTSTKQRSQTTDTLELRPEEIEAYRHHQEDTGILLRVLERFPDALGAVRIALTDALERRKREQQQQSDLKPPKQRR